MPSKLPRVERQLDLVYFTLGRAYSQMVRRLSEAAQGPSNTPKSHTSGDGTRLQCPSPDLPQLLVLLRGLI